MYYWFFKFALFVPVLRSVCRPWIENPENIPSSGGAILASNHLAYVDTIVLPLMSRRRVTFPAKAELFHQKSFLGRVVGWFLRAIGQVPMDRTGGRASEESLNETAQVLRDGHLLGIYPEGTRSPDGRLYKGRTGAARLALHHGVPVIPVGTVGTTRVKKLFGVIPYLDRPGVRIGRPLDFSAYADQVEDRQVLRWVTDEIMAAIQDLTGQEYVDAYSSSVKAGNFTPEQLRARVQDRPGNAGRPPAITTAEP
ncbi:lysophospholipid acyltransferase family protein [Granulicoccus phenolivorans]|uniref:lysophospholipid acyltransferase family protein n=1 Tax=Granulicoccus phenolivorans TaxID=266854 RepID=UPI0003FDAE03|nr:lysophospholipid acyltransferase family protein [Granulicoccus phenolivorans]